MENGIDDHSFISIYPNPATSKLNLEIDASEKDDLIIELYNNNGLLILQSKAESRKLFRESFEINELTRGIYHLKIFNSEVNYISKVVIY